MTAATSSSARPSTSTPDSSSNRASTASRSSRSLEKWRYTVRSVTPARSAAGAHGERSPVPGGEAVQQLGTGGEDALARLGGALTPHRAVVLAARSGWCRSSGRARATARSTGSDSHPRTVDVGARCGSCDQSTSHSGNRFSSSSSATRPSSRASAAPRQKCAPKPKVRCPPRSRWMSNRSGSGKRRSSWLAAPLSINIALPSGTVVPWHSTGFATYRPVCGAGVSKRSSSSIAFGMSDGSSTSSRR